jgi:pimeloyl-ACP methyl ester carboxylesterase
LDQIEYNNKQKMGERIRFLMRNEERIMKRNPVKPVLMGVGALTAVVIGAAGGWIVYSRLSIPDRVPLPEAFNAQRREFTSPAAGKLSYYVDASVAGRPLVLVHSVNAAASAFEMKPLFEIYRRRRPVYALDLPGYGFSERARVRYTPALFAAALRDWIASQIGEPADVVALSLGSEFAARAAVEYPEWIRSLVLISPTGLGLSSGSSSDAQDPLSPGGGSAHAWLSFPLWAKPLFKLIASHASIRYFLSKSFVGPVPQAMVEYAYLSSHQPGAEHVPFYFLSGQLFTRQARRRLYAHVDQPGLILYDQDAYTGFEDLPRLLKEKQNWHAERIIPTLGLPHWEMLPGCVDVLDHFWQALGS